ncbi:MAG: DciA family protein [Aliarcobacter sp.]|nr:DciA family protein [Aliarcobacter sp.]
MKKINEILSHLKNNPEFSKINTSFLIKKFIEVLPLKLKKGVKFAYVKNQTLYFVLTHPVYKMEFEYNKADIKSLLKNFKIANVEDIGFFITNVIEKKESPKEPIPLYTERAYGIFENKAKDEYIFKKFEKIREIIRNS